MYRVKRILGVYEAERRSSQPSGLVSRLQQVRDPISDGQPPARRGRSDDHFDPGCGGWDFFSASAELKAKAKVL